MAKAAEKHQEDEVPAAGEKPLGELSVPEAGRELVQVDFGDDAGAGMEDVKAGEYRIPFLRILQSNSPQVKPPTAGGVPGAQAAMIFNTSTGELYDGEKGLVFVPTSRATQAAASSASERRMTRWCWS
jgi:hypothetical protein